MLDNGVDKMQEQSLHFLDYWRVLQKRKEAIIATVIIIVLVTAAFTLIQKPQYIATATLEVSTKEQAVDLFTTTARTLAVDPQKIATHLSGILHENVLKRVVLGDIWESGKTYHCQVHGNYSEDEIRKAGTGLICPSPLCNEKLNIDKKKKYGDWIPLDKKWSARDREDYSELEAAYLLSKKLKVSPGRGTYLIHVSYQSESAKEAAQIATMAAEAYVQLRNDQQEEKLDQAMDILQNEILVFRQGDPEKRQKGLDKLEDELDEMGQNLGVSPEEESLLTPAIDIQNYRRSLTEIESQLVVVQEKLRQLDGLSDKDKVDVVPQSTIIAQLKAELVKAISDKVQMEENFGEKHPAVISKKELIKSIRELLYNEVEGTITAMKSNAEEMQARKKQTQKFIERAKKELLAKQAERTKYTRLKTEVDTKRFVYQQMISRKFQEVVASAIPLTEITLVQSAEIPPLPSKPKPTLNIILSLFIGLFVGTGLAYFIEYLDTSVKTLDDIERYLNIPILGVIPQNARLLTEEDHKSPVAEAYRMLWTNIEFAVTDQKIRTLLVTSSGVGEGKTTTAANLAIATAQMGYKVLLVDSDLRRPRIHKLLKQSNNTGWADILLRHIEPRETICATEVEGLSIIPSGKLPPNIVGLLNSPRIRESIKRIDDDFDIIILDSPPIIGVSDASIVANLADATLLVVEYRKYPKAMATRAKKALEAVGANLIGGVVNNLNVMKEDYYYYSQMYHYAHPEDEEVEESKVSGMVESEDDTKIGEEQDQHDDDHETI